MTQAGNIQVQTSFKVDRRDPHLRNGPKAFRFNPFQDEVYKE